jgi:hypothetical protein
MIEEQLKLFLDNNFNDEEKFSLIKANGLSAIMADYYSEYPLSEFAKKMKSNNRVIHIVKKGQMAKLIKDFDHDGISVLYFKGDVLQSLLFGNVDLRPAGDIDIYVTPAKFNTAMSILKDNGFIFRDCNTINNNHHVQYVKGHIKLELHKNLFNPFTKINETVFFDHLVPYKCKEYNCLTFDNTATILHLFYHLYMDTLLDKRNFDPIMKNNLSMAKRFLFRAYEIAKYVFIFKEQIDWDQINSDIASQKLRIYFKNMIIVINVIFPEILPKSFLNSVCKKEYTE